jgi:hypothetical protein
MMGWLARYQPLELSLMMIALLAAECSPADTTPAVLKEQPPERQKARGLTC